ncbi:MAG TPA: type I-E CRISPR-associated protein Cas7/Cse4/CasC, partial [Turneriella sp.]|nr:type I-E CRISPR-associated protein Cas7/Cse4/CasC [Turneriella sp.]
MSKEKIPETTYGSRFLQLHFLTSYPPSNLNRDDLGRPKTALMGGANRLRISSQSLKRAWRTSDVFSQALAQNRGVRTKNYGKEIFEKLVNDGIKEKDAKTWAKAIAEVFGKLKAEKKDDPLLDLEIEQLAHFSVEEQAAIDTLVKKLIKDKRAPADDELKLLRKENSAADIAMFGRMLASEPAYNFEAAVQVAHAITVHKVAVEDDFFTAVDDLNRGDEDKGAGHMGDIEFGAGLFYLYICINRELLLKNLNGDKTLAENTIAALVEAVATVAPTGKQNSF